MRTGVLSAHCRRQAGRPKQWLRNGITVLLLQHKFHTGRRHRLMRTGVLSAHCRRQAAWQA